MNYINLTNHFFKRRLFILLGLIPLWTIAQENPDRKITLNEKKISLEQVFLEIEKQTGYSIAYSGSSLGVKQQISVAFEHNSIQDALSKLLSETGYTYKIMGYHVVISPEEENNQEIKRKPVQTVRGKVIDSKTGLPISFASVGLSGSLGTMTDSTGVFILQQVPVGRYNLQVSYVGYQTVILPEILVTSSKEVFLDIFIQEKPEQLKEVIVRPEIDKSQTLNKMALTGGRLIRMEETSRFANGFDDPARLASVFAGVAGHVGNNALAIRGNSPQFTQWRVEGMEIPNPNHFSDISGLGGGFLSGLSTHVMGNSDFYNSAFPAEYSNALSGVFDMFIRNGNNQRYEHAFQFGLLGIDLASEGPLSKKHGSSYLFNYRFSTTSVATNNEFDMKYQDLTFKIHIPTKRAGEFSLWGIGLKDRNKDQALEQSEWETVSDRQNGISEQEKVIAGLTHKYRANEKTTFRSSVGMNYVKDWMYVDVLNEHLDAIPVGDILNRQWQLNLSSSVERRFSDKHINKTGFTLNGLKYDLDYKVSPHFGLNQPVQQVALGNGESLALSFYSQSLLYLNEQWSANIGVTSQVFTLNNHWTLEPRFALKWKFHPDHSLALSYGLHSRREKLDYYFLNMSGSKDSNKYLNFSKAHHIGLSYSWNISNGLHLRIEPYAQFLYDIPVESNSSFSVINYQAFYMDRLLVNEGKGRNYGVDFILERYLQKGYYYMFTGSLFKSTYKGGDGIWRSTQYNKGFILNSVAGKEWMVGRQKQNMFNVNLRFSVQGGDRYTPVDEQKSHLVQNIELDESRAFSRQFKPEFLTDLSMNYRINKRKISHEFSLKILNVNVYTGSHGYLYNEKTKTIKKEKGYGLIPNISYKIYF